MILGNTISLTWQHDLLQFETISQPSPAVSISRREEDQLSLARTQQEVPPSCSASSSRSNTLHILLIHAHLLLVQFLLHAHLLLVHLRFLAHHLLLSSRSSTLSRPAPPTTLNISRTSSRRSREEERQEWDAKLLGKPGRKTFSIEFSYFTLPKLTLFF